MAKIDATTAYKLIYVYAINDKAHEGLLKVGEATLHTKLHYSKIPADCDLLNGAAIKRIDSETKTAGVSFVLLYSEIAVREENKDGSIYATAFHDHDVHNVLVNSGILKGYPDGVKSKEWFQADLPTVKNAINAVKEWRTSLTGEEKSTGKTPIALRAEQRAAIDMTKHRFVSSDDVLWNAKMRFGKTLTALQLVKEMGSEKVIIITHRPVVGEGWHDDFYKIFMDDNTYSFVLKSKDGNVEDTDEPALDTTNDQQLQSLASWNQPFIYFTSLQDLGGSRLVGGQFDKNKAVFAMNWDLIIFDEAHEANLTELSQSVLDKLRKIKRDANGKIKGKAVKMLALSGTPFNISSNYAEDDIYTWDYVMEQQAKKDWPILHPGEPNPYQMLPQLHIMTYSLTDSIDGYMESSLEGKAFNFREFFRVWTGDPKVDHKSMPMNVNIGEFVHREDVRHFLNLMTFEDPNSNYPFANEEYRDMFRHTLWIVPGVKEAAALSAELKQHTVFSAFAIANVAGDGDREVPYDDALRLVKETIAANDYSITISCGKLTTGVTVKEWTAVLMLSGSADTSAAGYLQTIFRVQSAGCVNGQEKLHSYAFDFAPDRALTIAAKAVRANIGSGRSTPESEKAAMGAFLNFCPIIAVKGSTMTAYSVSQMIKHIKRIQVERAIKKGFDDLSVYNDKLMHLDNLDMKNFEDLRAIVGSSKAAPGMDKVPITDTGMTDEEHEKPDIHVKPPEHPLSPEEIKRREELKHRKKQRDSAISILRNISIRMPMLIYGADVPFDEDITLEQFVEMVDTESWAEFMPQGLSKRQFRQYIQYYDVDVFITAGREIRRLARDADDMRPTERVRQIATIFSYFRNPDKETVLTPWRVVNMHMGDILGGYSFNDVNTEPNLDEPNRISRGQVSMETLLNPNAHILEINSKSGLYPLYVAYSIYRSKLGSMEEEDLTTDQLNKMWRRTLEENVFVVCKTRMAKLITQRTLAGYKPLVTHAIYQSGLTDILKSEPDRFAKKVQKNKTWFQEGSGEMYWDAIIGNPPYQNQTNGGSDTGAAKQATPIFNSFVDTAKLVNPSYISMIIPARWYNGGMGLNDFRNSMLSDPKLSQIIDFIDSKDLFQSVDIAGGICYFLWDKKNNGDCQVVNVLNGERTSLTRRLDQYGDILVRSNDAIPIVDKVLAKATTFAVDSVSAIDTFGIPSKEKGHSNYQKGDILLLHSVGANSQGTSYLEREKVMKGKQFIDKYKVKISIMVPQNGEVGVSPEKGYRSISTPQILYPGTVDSFSYLNIGFFDTEEEAINYRDYITCKFTRYLMRITYSSVHISKNNFRFVPMLDFTQKWDDEKLYRLFELTQEEIDLIERTMRPMTLESEDIGYLFYKGDCRDLTD